MRRWVLAVAVLIGAGAVGAYFLLGRAPEVARPPATGPADAPFASPFAPSFANDQWPAFQGGGPLRGVAADAGAAAEASLAASPAQEERIESGASPAIAGSKVLVANARGVLLAFDLTSGKETWKYEADEGFEAGPLVVGDRIFIGDLGGTFHAVSLADGTKLWTIATEQPIRGSANFSGEADAARILFANDGGEVTCVDPHGKPLWKNAAPDRINGALAIADGRVYFAACDSRLRSWKLSDGSEVFSADMGALSGAAPVGVGERIVVGTDQGKVQCFDLAGRRQWTYEQIEDSAMVYATAAVADGLIVVGARDRTIHAINLGNGQRAWTLATRGDVDGGAIISNGRVYVGSRDRTFYVLDLKQGTELFSFTADRAITSSPAVAAGVIVFADAGGNVYCMESK